MIAIVQSIEVDISTGKIKKPNEKDNNSYLNHNKNVEVDDLEVTDTDPQSDEKIIPKCKNTKKDNPIKLDKHHYKYYTNPEDSTASSPCVQETPVDIDIDVENVDSQVEVFNPNSPPKNELKNTSVNRNVKPFYNVFYNIFPGHTETVYQPIITPAPQPTSPLIFIVLGHPNDVHQPLDIISQILTNIRSPNVINSNHQIPQNINNYIRPTRNLIGDSNVNYINRESILSDRNSQNNEYHILNKNTIPVNSAYRFLKFK